jgi:hypothetical protein
LVVHGGGEGLQAGQLLAFHFGCFPGEDFRVEGFLVFEEMPEDAGTGGLARSRSLGPAGLSERQPGTSQLFYNWLTTPFFKLKRLLT